MGKYLQTEYLTYGLVFLAVLLPIVLWKRDGDVQPHLGKGQRRGDMPWLFRVMWQWSSLFELAVGVPLCRLFPGKRERYEKWILAASLPLTPARLFTMQLFSFIGGAAVGSLFFLFPELGKPLAVAFSIAIGYVGWIYPSVLLEKYVEWRQTELTRQLPFAIDLIGSAMRAGLDFGAAMRYFEGLKMPGPLTEEFGKVLQQMELGKTRVQALEEMASRVQVEAFTAFVGVVAYGTEIGASISETLLVHGEELRRARFHLAERKAARAPSLMILPMALFIMPAVFIIVITPVIMRMKGAGLVGH